ncbi:MULTISPECIES: IS5 family transposase [Pirellulaceae]|uniref:Transposase DDE domain protein n=1 Tax=Mariniblastus fucicola TaxID=980251 RepID=A0A5B9PHZ9_9BACT|nr:MULTISPECIES: IS5 family transposase [Pirellulaceae]QEG20457.1 Transposase DDE domain protein [Mariniblastus fucicola]QEG21003.1 Transposase DDE domain protein [Mariniblastus fucicola]QEG21015.1 Transposase DDE domain protein [Mariniblastus fucicola]QEG21483.1 Transposase DDE domain protein [Mariniblastus fucicola]QEG21634.1 Transposase DDE domain protein [Mariniblastus fucicola]
MSIEYPSSLSDDQWRLLRRLIPPAKLRGRKRIDRRQIVDAILYWCRTGCQWRLLPDCFPNWNTVYGVYRAWRIDGTWQRIHDRLREKVRRKEGRKPTPTAAIIDSQSIRSAEGGELRGYDAAKRITGRKRHILVDTLGLVMVVVVHSADLQDYEGAHLVLENIRQKFRRLRVIFADSIYGRADLPEFLKQWYRVILQTVKRPVEAEGFVVLPKRWIVERTFAWLGKFRRLSKDYERLTQNSETVIRIAMIQFMLNRLEK